MLQPASLITEVHSATREFLEGECDLKAELRCFQCHPECHSAPGEARGPHLETGVT